MRTRRTRLAAAGATFAATAAALTLTATSASALPRDHQNPIGSVCMQDVRTVKSAPINDTRYHQRIGTVNLRYSPRCKTAWAQTLSVYGWDPQGESNWATSKVIRIGADDSSYRSSTHAGQKKVWTNMLNDDGFQSYAFGSVDTGMYTYSATTGTY